MPQPPSAEDVEPHVDPAPAQEPQVEQADRKRRKPPAAPPGAGGRGGPEHRYLQSLIKHYAEERGFRATVEATLARGGRVDVLLERGDVTIACEVSVTSTPAQEADHVSNCLSEGVSHIVVISPDRRTLRRLEKLLASLHRDVAAKVRCLTPEEFLVFLDEFAVSSGDNEKRVLGYRVKTNVRRVSAEERAAKRGAVVETVVRALKRLRAARKDREGE